MQTNMCWHDVKVVQIRCGWRSVQLYIWYYRIRLTKRYRHRYVNLVNKEHPEISGAAGAWTVTKTIQLIEKEASFCFAITQWHRHSSFQKPNALSSWLHNALINYYVINVEWGLGTFATFGNKLDLHKPTQTWNDNRSKSEISLRQHAEQV